MTGTSRVLTTVTLVLAAMAPLGMNQCGQSPTPTPGLDTPTPDGSTETLSPSPGAATPTAAPSPSEPTAAETPTTAPVTPPTMSRYLFTDGASLLYLQVFAAEGSTGHDHVIRATGYTGTITYNPADPYTCAVEVSFAAAAMMCDEDYMRDHVGYDAYLTPSQQTQVKNAMLADDQLDAAHFPTLSYLSSFCEVTAGGMRVHGDLTIHGVTQQVQVEMSVQHQGTNLIAQGQLNLTQTQFGIEPYKLLTFENSDAIKLSLEVVGVPAP